jgi:hypothetical protein
MIDYWGCNDGIHGKNEFILYLAEAIEVGRKDKFEKITIEEENESEGLVLSINFIKHNNAIGKDISEYKEAFYGLNNKDIKNIKEKLKVKIKIAERDDFGELVKTMEVLL